MNVYNYACCAPYCSNTSQNSKLFLFPPDLHRSLDLLQAINNIDLIEEEELRDRYFLCYDHSYALIPGLCLEELTEANHAIVKSIKYSCQTCSQNFSSLEQVFSHDGCSGDDCGELFTCDNCNSEFKTEEEIRDHFIVCLSMSQDEPQALRKSELFEMSDDEEASLPGYPNQLKSETSSYECGTCNKFFANATSLKNHLRVHNGDRPFACTQCDKRFTLKSCLKTHLKTIHTDRRFKCPYPECNKSYKSEHYLKTHLLIHAQQKNFECDACYKKFYDMQSLKFHMRTHTGERRYKCEVCGNLFVQQSHLKTHMRIHTQEKPYECPICGKAFRQLSNVLEHQKTHDKNRQPRTIKKQSKDDSESTLSHDIDCSSSVTRSPSKYRRR